MFKYRAENFQIHQGCVLLIHGLPNLDRHCLEVCELGAELGEIKAKSLGKLLQMSTRLTDM